MSFWSVDSGLIWLFSLFSFICHLVFSCFLVNFLSFPSLCFTHTFSHFPFLPSVPNCPCCWGGQPLWPLHPPLFSRSPPSYHSWALWLGFRRPVSYRFGEKNVFVIDSWMGFFVCFDWFCMLFRHLHAHFRHYCCKNSLHVLTSCDAITFQWQEG